MAIVGRLKTEGVEFCEVMPRSASLPLGTIVGKVVKNIERREDAHIILTFTDGSVLHFNKEECKGRGDLMYIPFIGATLVRDVVTKTTVEERVV